jgi:diguanylate cyclase (GGDEF)-like protein/PAS domain S-box-containing protein
MSPVISISSEIRSARVGDYAILTLNTLSARLIAPAAKGPHSAQGRHAPVTQDTATPQASGCPETEGCPADSEEMFKYIVEHAVDLIVLGDGARNRTYVSPSSREILGYEPAELLGKHAYGLVHPDDLSRTEEAFSRIGREHPNQDLTFRMRHKDGNYVWISGRYRHLPNDNGVLAVLRDITAQKLAEQQLTEAHARVEASNAALEAANQVLRSLADVDGLTGLANRRHFDILLGEEFARANRHNLPLGLVLLDVDHFKAFNDTYGHPGGDECLRQVSRCVIDALRRPSDHAARYGGEELAILLPATDQRGTLDVADRVRGAVARLGIEHVGSGFGVVTISAGTATTHPPRSLCDPAALLKAADIALYQAKAAGRNCVRSAGALAAIG